MTAQAPELSVSPPEAAAPLAARAHRAPAGEEGVSGVGLLLSGLAEAALAEARDFACHHLVVEVGPGDGYAVFDSGRVPPPALLREALTGFGAAGGPARSEAWGAVCRASTHVQLDVWEGGRQWRVHGAQGAVLGRVQELDTPEPVPAGARRGARLRFVPQPWLLQRGRPSLQALLARCRALAVVAPGLQVQLVDAAEGRTHRLCHPHGCEERVRELTAGRMPLHASPFVFDARWPEGRARCALQWCEGTEGQVHAFLDGAATRAEGPHVDGVLWAVRAGLAAAGHTSPDALSLERLRQGLCCVLSVETGPHAAPPAPEALTAQVVECLFPAVREAFGCHPATADLLARALTDA